MICFRIALELLLVLLTVALAIAQAPLDVLKGTCRRFGHQTAIIDRKLYIDGGWLYADPISQFPVPTISNKLIYSDLGSTSDGMPVQFDNLTKSDTVPDVSGGILWADEVNKVFWLYGGEFSPATGPVKLDIWGYDTILNQWNKSDATSKAAGSFVSRVAYGAGATLDRFGYYYGGYLNNLTNPNWSGGPYATSNLVVFDMNSSTISNTTGYDNIGRAEGVMLAIPASAGGMLVYFGGVSFPYGNSTEVPMDMSSILLYDKGDNKWYKQSATGQIPANRRKFCAGASWTDDQSSYNIYLYGGLGFGENATGFDEVYILSLPTFQWIKWWPTDSTIAYPKSLFTCNVVDRGQMIVMGGNYSNSSGCDVPNVGGQHNMALGQQNVNGDKWHAFLPEVTQYKVPKDVIAVVGGSSDGGATNRLPPGGKFDNSALGVYFNQIAKFDARTPTRYIPSATATVSTPTANSSSGGKPNIGAIAGGAVGGAVALIIAAVLIWWFCIRKRHGQRGEQVQIQHGTPQAQTVAPELNPGIHPGSNNTAAFSQAPGSPNKYAQQGLYPVSSSPPPQSMMYQQQMLGPQQYFPPQMQQQGYGPQPPYQPIGGPLPAGYMYPQQQQAQPYYPAPQENPRLSPPAHEMPVRGMTPGTYHVQQHYSMQQPAYNMQQPVPQGVNAYGIESVSGQSGADQRLDSRSQSTHSPTNSTWKG